MTDYQSEIIQRVKKIREDHDISQIKLADILNVSRGLIANVESPRYPHKYTLKQLKIFCDYVAMPLQLLFFKDEEVSIEELLDRIISYTEE